MASESGTLYVGVTNNLERRVYCHKNYLLEGFTYYYNCTKLVYYEHTGQIEAAIAREKQLKTWNRAKKEWLIKQLNPRWEDLAKDLK